MKFLLYLQPQSESLATSLSLPSVLGDCTVKVEYELRKGMGRNAKEHILSVLNALKDSGVTVEATEDEVCLEVYSVKHDRKGIERGAKRHKLGVLDGQSSDVVDEIAKSADEDGRKGRKPMMQLCLRAEVKARKMLSTLRKLIGRDDREQLKEAVFILGRELDDARYLRQFVEEDGVGDLLNVLDHAQGTTLAYALSSLSKVTRSSMQAMAHLVTRKGSEKMVSLLDQTHMLVKRNALRILCDICGALPVKMSLPVPESGYDAMHRHLVRPVGDMAQRAVETGDTSCAEEKEQNENTTKHNYQKSYYVLLVRHVSSEDIDTSSLAMRLINLLLDSANGKQKEALVHLLDDLGLFGKAMNSCKGILHHDVQSQLSRLQILADSYGIQTRRSQNSSQRASEEEVLKERIRQLEEELAQARKSDKRRQAVVRKGTEDNSDYFPNNFVYDKNGALKENKADDESDHKKEKRKRRKKKDREQHKEKAMNEEEARDAEQTTKDDGETESKDNATSEPDQAKSGEDTGEPRNKEEGKEREHSDRENRALLEAEISGLQSELSMALDDKKNAKERIEFLEDDMEKLKEKMKQMEAEVHVRKNSQDARCLQQQIEGLEQEKARSVVESERIKDDLQMLQNEKDELLQDILILREKKFEIELESNELHGELSRMKKCIESLRIECEEAEERAEMAHRRARSASLRLKELEMESERLEKDDSEMRQKVDRLEKMVKELLTEKVMMQKTLKDMEVEKNLKA